MAVVAGIYKRESTKKEVHINKKTDMETVEKTGKCEEEKGKAMVEKNRKPTINDLRKENGLPEIPGGDIVLTKV